MNSLNDRIGGVALSSSHLSARLTEGVQPPAGRSVDFDGFQLRSQTLDDVFIDVEASLDVHLDLDRMVFGMRGATIGFPTSANTWVRLSWREASKAARRSRTGPESASQLPDAVMRPTLLRSHRWSDPGRSVEWRADESEMITAQAVERNGIVHGEPDLPDAWWGRLATSLSALSGYPTARMGVPQERVTRRINQVFGDQALDTEVDEWRTAHCELHWGKVTAPQCYLLDWESWGMGPRGLDAARLWVTSLLVPALAERVQAQFASDLTSRSGLLSQLLVCANVIEKHRSKPNPGPLLGPARLEAGRLIEALRSQQPGHPAARPQPNTENPRPMVLKQPPHQTLLPDLARTLIPPTEDRWRDQHGRLAPPFIAAFFDALAGTGHAPVVEAASSTRWTATLMTDRVRWTADLKYRSGRRMKLRSRLFVDNVEHGAVGTFEELAEVLRDPDTYVQRNREQLPELPPAVPAAVVPPDLRKQLTAASHKGRATSTVVTAHRITERYWVLRALRPDGVDIRIGFQPGVGNTWEQDTSSAVAKHGQRDITWQLRNHAAALADMLATFDDVEEGDSGRLLRTHGGSRSNSVEIRRDSVIRV